MSLERWGSSTIAITGVLSLSGVSLAMLGPYSDLFNGVFRQVSGLPDLSTLLGRASFLVASVIFLRMVLSRLGTDQIMHQKMRQLVGVPGLFVVPGLLLLYLFTSSSSVASSLDLTANEWARLESAAWGLVILYVQVCICQGLRVLSYHPRHRKVAVPSLVICSGAIVTLLFGIFSSLTSWHSSTVEYWAWVVFSVALGAFVLITTRRAREHLHALGGQKSEGFEPSIPSLE